jgi:hypothetical protein
MGVLVATIAAVVATLGLVGCSSEPSTPVNIDTGTITSGVYLFDNGSDYRYIHAASGIAALRARVSKDYDLSTLVDDDYCFIKPESVRWVAGNERWLRVHKENIYFQTATQGAGGEIWLSYEDNLEEPDYQDSSFVFYIHEFGKVDGKLSVSIESMKHRGYYFTNTGNILAGNGITLQKFETKEQAPRVLIHQMSTVVGIGN